MVQMRKLRHREAQCLGQNPHTLTPQPELRTPERCIVCEIHAAEGLANSDLYNLIGILTKVSRFIN